LERCLKLDILVENDDNKLVAWSNYQIKMGDKIKSAFYDGVFVDILDIDDYNKLNNDCIEYHIETGRLSYEFMPDVSIIIPAIREDGAKKCIEAIIKNAVVPENKYEILVEYDHDRIGVPKDG